MTTTKVAVGKAPCTVCKGTGEVAFEIDTLELAQLINGLLLAGNKMGAIRAVREKWPVGLHQAKDVVESFENFTVDLAKAAQERHGG